MKKTLLFVVAVVINIAAYAQTSLGAIPYTSSDATFSGTTLAVPTSFTCSSGMGIFVNNQSYTGTDYWDLSTYAGIELSMTVDESYVGQSSDIRFVMVGSDAAVATSFVKTCTFSTATQIVALNFTADATPTKYLWAIKVPYNGATGFPVTVNSLNAVNFFTAVKEIQADDNNALVNVYDVTGNLIHKDVKRGEIMKSLNNGLYIIGNKKVFINNL